MGQYRTALSEPTVHNIFSCFNTGNPKSTFTLKTLPETAAFQQRVTTLGAKKRSASNNKKLAALAETWKPLAGQSRDIAKFIEHLHRLIEKNLETVEGTYNARKHKTLDSRKIRNNVKVLNERRKALVESLNLAHYFHRQAQWLLERFPAGVYCDVEGLCKRVDISEIKNNRKFCRANFSVAKLCYNVKVFQCGAAELLPRKFRMFLKNRQYAVSIGYSIKLQNFFYSPV